ncbi:MAG: leucine--tRNA ligase [Patescibacteria group bacterium]
MKDRPDQERFNHQQVDKKWQARWLQTKRYQITGPVSAADKAYILDMFPYPSGEGLHVGHPLGYIGSDILARYMRARGKKVLHPMGYDAFGLPAENYAIKSGLHPAVSTNQAIERFRQQMQKIGLSYDWDREVNSSDPDYYRWTQWLFLKLYEMDLAYRAKAPVNWCPKDQTVLANEQVKDGKCERCDSLVLQKELEQWFFRMTSYADEYLTGLADLDWPEPIKLMQRNWVGRSEGALVSFPMEGGSKTIEVFTTRIDTIFGAAFVVLAPEHPLVGELTTSMQAAAVTTYVENATKKTPLERTSAVDQTGIFTGSYALNPLTKERLPIWISDFVIGGYGTGAVFGDAHDERDFAMAKRYDIPLKVTVLPSDNRQKEPILALEVCFTDDGVLIDSGAYTGLTSAEARPKIIEELQKSGLAQPKVQYKLRDWLVSRQRYWGAPIPIVYCQNCLENSKFQIPNSKIDWAEINGEKFAIIPIPEDQLPVRLPMDIDFRPTGESPLARSTEFHHAVTCPKCHKQARREVDTMDTFVDSSWYFLRYISPHDQRQAFDREEVKNWLPVDWYVGGAEHAVLHLLYSRFMTKALADGGYLTFREPFTRLRNQGLILGEDNRKMSKRWGNVVNPDEVVSLYGADALRCFEMFMGPFQDSKPWSTNGLIGVRRWLERVWRLTKRLAISDQRLGEDNKRLQNLLNKTIQKVTSDIENFQFNTAISQLMILTNGLEKETSIDKATWQTFFQLLAPFAPHLAHELWEKSSFSDFPDESWPEVDRAALKDETIIIPVQVNGRVRGQLKVEPEMPKETLIQIAKELPTVGAYLKDKELKQTIVVPGRIVNFVIL